MRVDCIRHPTRGKAHRLTGEDGNHTACGRWTRGMTEFILVERTAPEDRCRACWPPGESS